jgi:hypothetical protein
MKYYITLKDLVFPDKKDNLVIIPENTLLRKVDDRNNRNSYLTQGNQELPAEMVEGNPTYFTEISEKEYKAKNIDIMPIVKMINELAIDTGLTVMQIVDKLDEKLGIIRQWNVPSTTPFTQPIPYTPNPYDITCQVCGKKPGNACMSITCPNRLTITYSNK